MCVCFETEVSAKQIDRWLNETVYGVFKLRLYGMRNRDTSRQS